MAVGFSTAVLVVEQSSLPPNRAANICAVLPVGWIYANFR
jgi:hypothetical protein